ncbi:hypothetical protein DTO013E5_9601 [Penicillium roqueforti]|nr:hypothetical protein DTO013F2_10540 [Penicillium roqueforti]KAI2768234.1 hypothetical protein DTO012A8_6599 [Penicillium roqueforti]KAI3063796.1 hypothetical protein CBS147339_9591 [Penicillium roqueforti]KAI3176263.1 hypothetical protein DTO032C6_9768 [Penicillium roqueforti]KAI3198501.1 hypothetical protein DTO013E5_9601 [Penicillium roqueforti]
MSGRHANIGFDDFRTETELLVNAGLAQGPPLSPILFAFFNADLVVQPVDSHGGAKRGEHLEGRITFDGADVKPSPSVKLLGVVFDQELRWKEHVQQAIKRATKTTVALNYASTVWHDPLRDKTHLRHLNTVQRTVLIRILSAFRTVATTTLEVEAYLPPTHLRLRHRAQRTIARLHTPPRAHPIWSALSRAQNRRNNVGSYARFPLAEALKTMDVDRLNELETIDPSPLPPWRANAFSEIELGSDREIARGRADSVRNMSDIVVYSDASGREDHLGTAIVALNDQEEVVKSQQVQVGPMERWSVHVAELIGIFYAVDMVFKLAHRRTNAGDGVRSTATILCDSRSALQSYRQLPRFRQRISDSASSGCQDIVGMSGMMQQIDLLRKPRNRVKPIPSDRYYRERTHPSAVKFMPNGVRSGRKAPKARADGMPEAPYAADGIEKESRERDEQRVEPAGRLKGR